MSDFIDESGRQDPKGPSEPATPVVEEPTPIVEDPNAGPASSSVFTSGFAAPGNPFCKESLAKIVVCHAGFRCPINIHFSLARDFDNKRCIAFCNAAMAR